MTLIWPPELSASACIPLTLAQCTRATMASLWPTDMLRNVPSPRRLPAVFSAFSVSSKGTPTEAVPSQPKCIRNLYLVIFSEACSVFFIALIATWHYYVKLVHLLPVSLTDHMLPVVRSLSILFCIMFPAPSRGSIVTYWVMQLIQAPCTHLATLWDVSLLYVFYHCC